MKEELQKEGLSIIKEEIAEIKSSLKERMKLPVLVAYCIILVLYNWDVLFYFVLESGTATDKIDYIKRTFTNVFYHRYLCPLLFAGISTFIFPVIQVGINYLFNWFKKQNYSLIKADDTEKTQHEKDLIDLRSSNKEREILQTEVDNKEKQIQGLKQEIQDITSEKLKLEANQKLLGDNLQKEKNTIDGYSELFDVFRDVLYVLTTKDYKAKILKYPNHFKSFYNYYLDLETEEQEFVREFLSFYTLEGKNDVIYSIVEEINTLPTKKKDNIVSTLKRFGIIQSSNFDVSFKLTKEGTEVNRIFSVIDVLYNTDDEDHLIDVFK